MARAGLEAAVLNVRINLLEIADEEWKSEIQEQVSVLLKEASEVQKGCQERLEEILDS
jgi:formiminotetrahydrofolate cyclodeaminase